MARNRIWNQNCKLIIAAFFACAVLPQSALAAQPVPPLPPLMVLDEPSLLTSEQRKIIETLLIEHADATGERILLAVLKNLDGADPTQRTHEIFEDWLASRGQDKGALLAVYPQETKARFEAGYGLQATIEKASRTAIEVDLMPELKAGHAFKALGLTLLDLLRSEASPLIDSGRAVELLQTGGIEDTRNTAARSSGAGSWFAFVILGALLFVGVLYWILSAEAQFTGEGWYRTSPWKRLSPQSLKRALGPGTPGIGGADGSW